MHAFIHWFSYKYQIQPTFSYHGDSPEQHQATLEPKVSPFPCLKAVLSFPTQHVSYKKCFIIDFHDFLPVVFLLFSS